jgi:DNA polymerase elongation subunit (family B)
MDRIRRIGNYETYNSWGTPGKKIEVFRVYVDHPASAPNVSDELFKQGFNCFEFDIKYIPRVLTDIAVDKNIWLFDTGGKTETIKVLVYDIENPGAMISIIGYYQFEMKVKSKASLKEEEFDFEIVETPDAHQLLNKYNKGLLTIPQLIAKSPAEEVANLHKFVLMVMSSHVIVGHNIYGYDNVQVLDRIKYYMENKSLIPNGQMYADFQRFVESYVYDHQEYNEDMGVKERNVFFYPTSLDTWPMAKKMFRYLKTANFSLKKLVPALGFYVKNRVYMPRFDAKDRVSPIMLKYNRDDMIEQICLSVLELQQALPMAFIANYPFEFLSKAGNIQLWDYMTNIRAYLKRVIAQPQASPLRACNDISAAFPENAYVSKADIENLCRTRETKGDLLKIGKYGQEMPNWAIYPRLVQRHLTVGGLPLKPQELRSQYVMWFGIVEADVQGMYPNLLISLNATADRVRFAKKGEKPDDYVYLWEMDADTAKLLEVEKIKTVIGKEAFKVGIIVSKEPGLETYPMKGVLKVIAKVRLRRKESDVMQNMYDSLKALRNAGTHGIQLGVKWSCRQFNLASGDYIPSKGQDILSDMYSEAQKRKVRTIYGDTDGIYFGCYRSAYKVPGLVDALLPKEDLDLLFKKKKQAKKGHQVIYPRKKIVKMIDKLNERWRERLKYKGFAIEVEFTPAMIISMHKNYIKIKIDKSGEIDIDLKGANFTAKDKPKAAEDTLKKIIIDTVRDNIQWDDEADSALRVNGSIRRRMSGVISHLKPDKLDVKDLILIQKVKGAGYYKDGNIYKKRSEALGKLIGEIHGTVSLDFVVTTNPIPGMEVKSGNKFKPSVKPIAFMTPVDLIKDKSEIDYDWYRNMTIDYISSCFAFDKKQVKRLVGDGKTSQCDLASFM